MQILVTGASGYVGAALVPRLRAAGHAVRGYGALGGAHQRRRSTTSSRATRSPAPGSTARSTASRSPTS